MKVFVSRVWMVLFAGAFLCQLSTSRAEEIGAKQPTGSAAAAERSGLSQALAFHATFDRGLDADFARGDKKCYDQTNTGLSPASPNDDVQLDAEGRFGGGLHFVRKNDFWPAYKDAGTLNYNDKNWNASVSVWLRLNPDEDLEPGYCDPVQIVGNDYNKGFIFLEWSRDDRPRHFRYAIRPLARIYNPEGKGWEEIPANKRPMVQIERAPFTRDDWKHVVFTLENVNDKDKPKSGRLYLNGKPQGAIENWDLTIEWNPADVLLVIGANYVGRMDDLAVFDRALSDREVEQLHALEQGVGELR